MTLALSEARRLDQQAQRQARADLGQVFTPASIASFMASMFELDDSSAATLLDPGAGTGQLAAAFAERWRAESDSPLRVTAYELDDELWEPLSATLRETGCEFEVIGDEYVVDAMSRDVEYDYAILNPPYSKLASSSPIRRAVGVLVDAPNTYAAFVALAVHRLRQDGQVVAIIPRSFANGTYFESIRRFLLSQVAVLGIHVYDSRRSPFADSAVLQEIVIVHLAKRPQPPFVEITSSPGPNEESSVRLVPFEEVVYPNDPEKFVHISPNARDAEASLTVRSQPTSLPELGIAVSTGRVVDFRSKDMLRRDCGRGDAPLIYPQHLRQGRVVHPLDFRKYNGLARDESTEKLLLPNGNYVLVKRFSAKEERRRIVATVLRATDLSSEVVAVENHLNVFHAGGAGIDADLAFGLAVWLNSSIVDAAFRQFSGHTQVNASDLRSLRYPTSTCLRNIGAQVGAKVLDQDEVDSVISDILRTAA